MLVHEVLATSFFVQQKALGIHRLLRHLQFRRLQFTDSPFPSGVGRCSDICCRVNFTFRTDYNNQFNIFFSSNFVVIEQYLLILERIIETALTMLPGGAGINWQLLRSRFLLKNFEIYMMSFVEADVNTRPPVPSDLSCAFCEPRATNNIIGIISWLRNWSKGTQRCVS